jgi:hypothetical protein
MSHLDDPEPTEANSRRLYFAVRQGKGVKGAIFLKWKDCQEHVDVTDTSVKYSAFNNLSDAVAYLEYAISHETQDSSRSTFQGVTGITDSAGDGIDTTNIGDDAEISEHDLSEAGIQIILDSVINGDGREDSIRPVRFARGSSETRDVEQSFPASTGAPAQNGGISGGATSRKRNRVSSAIQTTSSPENPTDERSHKKGRPRNIIREAPNSWEEIIRLMETLVAVNGHGNISSSDDSKTLAYFAKKLRRLKLDKDNGELGNTLTDEQERQLVSFGFDFSCCEEDIKRKYAYSFEDRMEQLQVYKEQNGGDFTSLPSRSSLGKYVMRLREGYQHKLCGKKSVLTDDRLAELASLGVSMIPSRAYKRESEAYKTWDERFQDLLDYKKIHGHSNVMRLDGALGNWVNDQRTQYKFLKIGKKSSMTMEKIMKLSEIHFDWRCDPLKGK